jgi:hypothetical protein
LVRETLDVDERDEIDEEDDCCGWVDGTLDFPSKLTDSFSRYQNLILKRFDKNLW